MAYERKVGEKVYRFSKPDLDRLDRYMRAAPKGVTKASIQLSRDIVHPEDREEWNALVQNKPGHAVQLANTVLEDMGFSGDDED